MQYRSEFICSSGLFLATAALAGCAGAVVPASTFLTSKPGTQRSLQSLPAGWTQRYINNNTGIQFINPQGVVVITEQLSSSGMTVTVAGHTLTMPGVFAKGSSINAGQGVTVTRTGGFTKAGLSGTVSGHSDFVTNPDAYDAYATVAANQFNGNHVYSWDGGTGGTHCSKICPQTPCSEAIGWAIVAGIGLIAGGIALAGCATIVLCGVSGIVFLAASAEFGKEFGTAAGVCNWRG